MRRSPVALKSPLSDLLSADCYEPDFPANLSGKAVGPEQLLNLLVELHSFLKPESSTPTGWSPWATTFRR